MASGSPGYARAISGRGTGLTPGPGSMPSMGANHGWRTTEGLKWGGRAAAERRSKGELLASGNRAVGCAAALAGDGGRGQLSDMRWGAGGAAQEGVKENEGVGAFLMVLQSN